jgi:hypothetical protein
VRGVIARVVLLLIAVGAGGYAVARHGDLSACGDARHAVFSIGVQGTGPGAPSTATAAAAVRRLRAACEDAQASVAGAQAMVVAGHPALALGLARDATDREARDVAAWGVLAVAAEAAGDRAAAATARRRVRALNPRGSAQR